MQEIDSLLEKAASVDVVWSPSEFFAALNTIKKSGFEVAFWDGEENWATILHDGDIVGYVWQQYPLIMFLDEYEDRLKSTLKNFPYLVELTARSLTNCDFQLESELWKSRLIGGMNYDSFSIEDLWFNTNSV